GGPANLMETALVQDAASRLSNATPERIVEYRPPRLGSAVRCYTSVGSSIVVAIAVLAAIIEYRLPSSRALDPATVAVMQTAGDYLEQSTKAIEAGIKPGTPTATLAEQQADLARALKNTPGHAGPGRSRPLGKTEALKALSAIGEKLGDRKSELENTRASEI